MRLMGKKRRKITPRNILAAANARLAPLDAGRVHRDDGRRCIEYRDEYREGEQGAEAREGEKEYGADGVLGNCGIVYVVGCLGFGFLTYPARLGLQMVLVSI